MSRFSLEAAINPTVDERAAEREGKKMAQTFEEEIGGLSPEADMGGFMGSQGGGGAAGGAAGAAGASGLMSKVSSGGMLKAGLVGAVGFGILQGVQKLAQASPALQQTMDMFGSAMSLFFRPFGNFLAGVLRPASMAMLQMGVKFIDLVKGDGLPVAIGSISGKALKGFGKGIAKNIKKEFKGDSIGEIFINWLEKAVDTDTIAQGIVDGFMSEFEALPLIDVPKLTKRFGDKITNAWKGWPDIGVPDIVKNPPSPIDWVKNVVSNSPTASNWYETIASKVDANQWIESIVSNIPGANSWVNNVVARVPKAKNWYDTIVSNIPNAKNWYQSIVANVPSWDKWVFRLMPKIPAPLDWVNKLISNTPSVTNWLNNIVANVPTQFNWYNTIVDNIPSITDWLGKLIPEAPSAQEILNAIIDWEGGNGNPNKCDPPCGAGEKCVNGTCVPDDGGDPPPKDPCDGVNCKPGEICIDGDCVDRGGGDPPPKDPCDGVNCQPWEYCVDGTCVSDPRKQSMAEGGLVRSRTTATIGEAGPEAVMPLNELSSVIRRAMRQGMTAANTSGGGGGGGGQNTRALERKLDTMIRELRRNTEAVNQAMNVTVEQRDQQLDPF